MVKKWLARLPARHYTQISQHFGELPDIEPPTYPSQNGPRWAWWAVAVLPIDPRVQMVLLAMSSFQERLIALKKVRTAAIFIQVFVLCLPAGPVS